MYRFPIGPAYATVYYLLNCASVTIFPVAWLYNWSSSSTFVFQPWRCRLRILPKSPSAFKTTRYYNPEDSDLKTSVQSEKWGRIWSMSLLFQTFLAVLLCLFFPLLFLCFYIRSFLDNVTYIYVIKCCMVKQVAINPPILNIPNEDGLYWLNTRPAKLSKTGRIDIEWDTPFWCMLMVLTCWAQRIPWLSRRQEII